MARIAMIVSNGYAPVPRIHKEALALCSAGHDLTVYAFDRAHEFEQQQEVIDGVCVKRYRGNKLRYGDPIGAVTGMRGFFNYLREALLSDRPQIVHCNDQDTCPVGLWWKEHGPSNAKFVFDAHDLYWTFAERRGANPFWWTVAKYLRSRDRHFAKRCDRMITTTDNIGSHPGQAAFYKSWGVTPVVIWNAPLATMKATPLPAKFTVGYVGRVRYIEPFRTLVEALRGIAPEMRPALRVAGDGIAQRSVSELLESARKELNLDLAVTARFSMRETETLINACSVQYCIYPPNTNINHTLPVKMFDSLVCGRKVIVNANSLMGAFVKENQLGWQVDANNPESLAAILTEARTQYDPNSQPQNLSPMRWQEQAKRLVHMYAGLISEE